MRTVRALELLAERPRSAPDIATVLGVHPRTVRRLLRRLVREGYVSSGDRAHEYTLTLKIVVLAHRVVQRSDLLRVGAPYVLGLRNELGETAHFCVPSEAGAIHMIEEAGQSIVSAALRAGRVAPYHASAVGKAMLANLQIDLQPLFERGFTSVTPHTIVDPAELLLELAKIRQTGYATDDRESDLELRCCAAPVFDGRGDVVGAIGISAPASRLPTARFPVIGQAVVATSQSLSSALGHGVR